MNTNLAPEQLSFLHAAIAKGRYKIETEALNEAVRLLQRRDELEQSLVTASEELDAGLGIPAEVFRRLEDRISVIERESSASRTP